MEKMKAAVVTKYGAPEVVKLKEVAKPVPKSDEILVKIAASGVSSGDCRIRGLNIPQPIQLLMRLALGFSKPKQPILGFALAGEIEAVGKDVTKYKVGDKVFGSAGFAMGAHAEYAVLPEKGNLVIKPDELSWEKAAAIPFGYPSALHFLRKGNISPGKKVLIYGASGAVGSAAVELARHFEAEVTGVCSTANIELVKSRGAHHVVDYTKEDFTQKSGYYDIVFDAVGHSPFAGSLKALKRGGYYLRIVHLEIGQLLLGLWASLTSGRKIVGGQADEKLEDFQLLKELYQQGKIKPLIDSTFPLAEADKAHRRVDSGRKRGNVILKV